MFVQVGLRISPSFSVRITINIETNPYVFPSGRYNNHSHLTSHSQIKMHSNEAFYSERKFK